MGNSTSSVALPTPTPSNSYPKHQRHSAVPPPVVPSPVNKVLPVPAVPDQRALLRSTQNGAILHQGGTISGRRYSIGALHTSDEHRLQSVQESADMGSPQQHRRRHTMGSTSSKGGRGGERERKDYLNLSDGSPEATKWHPKKQHFFGSEPDLRAPTASSPHHHQHLPQIRPPRMRKKYKAPAPPPTHMMDSKDSGARVSPQRTRLFRTRAETQMNSSSARTLLQEALVQHHQSNCHVGAARSSWREGDGGERRNDWRGEEGEVSRRSWREGGEVGRRKWRSGAEEGGERRGDSGEAGRRKWRSGGEEGGERRGDSREAGRSVGGGEKRKGEAEKPAQNGKWLSSSEFQAELLKVTLDRGMRKASSNPRSSSSRSGERTSNRENSKVLPIKEPKVTEIKNNVEQQPWKTKSQPEKANDNQVTPPTPFYFGMETKEARNSRAKEEERENVERFAAQLRRVGGVDDSCWSSRGEEWKKKRGSSSSRRSEDEDDEEAEESGIDLCLRPTLPKKQPQVPRFSPVAAWRLLGSSTTALHLPEHSVLLAEGLLPEKVVPAAAVGSGSGVVESEPRGEKSADSGISGDASPGPGAPISRGVPSSPTVWTPQQDLAEDESSSEGSPVNVPHPPHVLYLSLSLPRTTDCSMWRSSIPKGGRETSLDKIRRSVSGAIFGRPEDGFFGGERPLDDNWSLGRCGVRADGGGHQSGGEGIETGCAGRGRVVYLPRGPLSPSQRCHSLDLLGGEILAGGTEALKGPKEGWEEDAVRRVEEDFERGRALDRARLRVQLRALNEAESALGASPLDLGPSSLPIDVRYEGEGREASPIGDERARPDLSSSAPPSSSSSPLPSSSPSPSPARRRRGPPSASAVPKLSRREWRRDGKRPLPPPTRVLSEFRQQRREYREPPKGSTTPVHQHIRHPSVVCDIPKSGENKQEASSSFPDSAEKTELTPNARIPASSNPTSAKSPTARMVSDNYRRDFAHGSLPTPLQVLDGESESDRRSNHRNPSRSMTPLGKPENPSADLNVKSNASSASSSCSMGAPRRTKCTSGDRNSPDGISKDVSSESRRNAENGCGSSNVNGMRSKGPLFSSLQPYTPGKGYRPISFNPGNQTQKLAQSVS